MSKIKQTAVEWFFNELERMQYFIGNDMLQAYKEAKEIERKQIMDAYNSDRPLLSCFEDGSAANEYYNETYEGNK